MKPVFIWIFFAHALPSLGLNAQERPTRCVLTVSVLDEVGQKYDGATVQLVNDKGQKVWDSKTVNGEVCVRDFPFGNHSVIVEPEGCHPVAVHNVRISLVAPNRLIVTKQGCPHLTGNAACMLYVRAVSANGQPIPGAKMRTVDHKAIVKADEFGRLMMAIPLNERPMLIVEASGYRPLTFGPQCVDIKNSLDKEAILEPEE